VYNKTQKTGHKISTQGQAEHPVHNSLSVRAFSVKYNKTHKSQLKYEIQHDLCKI